MSEHLPRARARAGGKDEGAAASAGPAAEDRPYTDDSAVGLNEEGQVSSSAEVRMSSTGNTSDELADRAADSESEQSRVALDEASMMSENHEQTLSEVITWMRCEVEALAKKGVAADEQDAEETSDPLSPLPHPLVDMYAKVAFLEADSGLFAKSSSTSDSRWQRALAQHPLGPGLLIWNGLTLSVPDSVRLAQRHLHNSSTTPLLKAVRLCRIAEVWIYGFGDIEESVSAAHHGLRQLASSQGGDDRKMGGSRNQRTWVGNELKHIYLTALSLAKTWEDCAFALTSDGNTLPNQLGTAVEAAEIYLDRLNDAAKASELLESLIRSVIPQVFGASGSGSVGNGPKNARDFFHQYRALCLALDVMAKRSRDQSGQLSKLDRLSLVQGRLILLEQYLERSRDATIGSELAQDRGAAHTNPYTALHRIDGEDEVAAVRFSLALGMQERDALAAIDSLLELANMASGDQEQYSSGQRGNIQDGNGQIGNNVIGKGQRVPGPRGRGTWGPHLAASIAYATARDNGEWQRAIAALDVLAGPFADVSADDTAGTNVGLTREIKDEVVALAHAWRAAELSEAMMADRASALARWRAICAHSEGGPWRAQAERAVERLLVTRDPAALAAHFEISARRIEVEDGSGRPDHGDARSNGRGITSDVSQRPKSTMASRTVGTDHAWHSFCLHRAAVVIGGRERDFERALALQSEALAHAAVQWDALEFLLAVHRRRRDRKQLIEAYRQLHQSWREPRVGATCLCAIGGLQWLEGDLEKAAESFSAAAHFAPRDPIPRLALAGLYRIQGRHRELLAVLTRLVDVVVAPELAVVLLRELGQLYANEFHNTRRARELLERALKLDPKHAATLHSIAKLHDNRKQWGDAISLRRKALQALQEDGDSAGDRLSGDLSAAEVLLEIGDIEEHQRKDQQAALKAYEDALAADDDCVDAIQAQQRIHRAEGHVEQLIALLRSELGHRLKPERRLEIQLEIATLTDSTADGDADNRPRDVASSLEAYLEALEVDASNETALAGIARIGRTQGEWVVIANAYRQAPATADNLAILADALRATESWRELVEVEEQRIDVVFSAAEKGKLAFDIAEILHRRLGMVDRAAAMYQQAIDCGISVPQSQAALVEMFAANKRWTELETAYEADLARLYERTEGADSGSDPGQVSGDSDAASDGANGASHRERQGSSHGGIDGPDSQVIEILMKLGELRREHLNKPTEALESFEDVLDIDPEHAEALKATEELYDLLGREDDLLRVLTAGAAMAEEPDDRGRMYRRIAEIKQGRDDVDGAIIAYRQAFDANPANRTVFTDMEKLCYVNERWNDALALYDTAIERVEAGLHRAYRLGDLYARRGQVQLQYLKQLDDAAASYRRVIEIEPDNNTALKYLDTIYSETEDWPALIDAYETCAQLATEDKMRVDCYRHAARIAGNKLRDPVEAARIYESLLLVEGRDEESLAALERFYERDKKWDGLVAVLQRRLEGAPKDTAVAMLMRIAQICEDGLRDPKQAAEHYRSILELTPGNAEALEALGRIYESTEQWTEFIEVTRRQIRVTSDRNIKALLYFKCGSVMEAKFSKEEDAIRYYDAAIKTSPSCLPAVHGLRDLYRRRKDWPRVIQTLELEVKLWQDKKERAGVSAQIGRIYAEFLNNSELALHYYESALAQDPECLPANQSLFEIYFQNSEWDRAKPLAQLLVQRAVREGDPGSRSEFYRKYGIVSMMTGDPRAGAESLVIALEIKPTNLDALDSLSKLAGEYPDAYNFDGVYRDLEKIYRKREDAEALLARVQISRAGVESKRGDLDAAIALYEEANSMCSGDWTILSALVDFYGSMRKWSAACQAIDKFLKREPAPAPDIRAKALMRQADIYSNALSDTKSAIAALAQARDLDADDPVPHYRMAQELYCDQQYEKAALSIDKAIEIAASPTRAISPETLSRYYYYRGHIIEARGDVRKALSQYRRSVEYDPTYAPPAVSIARQTLKSKDFSHAETSLINAAHVAIKYGGVDAAVPMQRGLARMLLATGDRPGAIEAYRGILNVQSDNIADRYELAEIYAGEDPSKALNELNKVIARDIYYAPTYSLLADLYRNLGEPDRARRAQSVKTLLGFVDDPLSDAVTSILSSGGGPALKRPLSDEVRRQIIVNDAATGPVGELFSAIVENVTSLFKFPFMGEALEPIATVANPAFQQVVSEMLEVTEAEVEIYVGERVPGAMVVLGSPRRVVVFDRTLIQESESAWRFLLGWALDCVTGDYALLGYLTERQIMELGSLMSSLFANESERAAPTNEFVEMLPRKASKLIEQYAGSGIVVDAASWATQMMAIAKRAGLFACDDLATAVRMIARLNGEQLHKGPSEILGACSALAGADLIRFYLAEDYHRVRNILCEDDAVS